MGPLERCRDKDQQHHPRRWRKPPICHPSNCTESREPGQVEKGGEPVVGAGVGAAVGTVGAIVGAADGAGDGCSVGDR